MSFVDCLFRGLRATEIVETGGSILFRNVKIETAEKSRSLEFKASAYEELSEANRNPESSSALPQKVGEGDE